MIVSLGAGVLKHLPGQHDQSTHGSRGMGTGVAQSILERVRENGGLSVKMVDGSEPPSGYMVAKGNKDGEVFPAKEFYDPVKGPKILSDYLKSHKADLGSGKYYLGLWHNKKDGNVALDISENIQDKATAISEGKQRNQISIWDVVNLKEIQTGGTGVTKREVGSRGVTEEHFGDDGFGNRGLRTTGLGQVGQAQVTYSGLDLEPIAKHGDPSRPGYAALHPNGGGKGAQGTTSELSDDEIRDVIYGSKTINEMYAKIAKRQGKSMKPSVALLSADEVTHYRGVQFVGRDAQRLLDGKIRRFEHATWGQGIYLASDKGIASNYGTLIGVKLDASAKLVQGETKWASAFDVSYDNPHARTMATTSSSFIDFDRLTARVGSGQMEDFSVSDLLSVYWAGKGYDGLTIHGETALFNGSKLTVNSADVGNAVQKHLPGQHDQSSHGRRGGGHAGWAHFEDTKADNIAVSDVFVKEFGKGTLVVAFEDNDPEFGLDAEGQQRVMKWIEETQASAPIVGEPFTPSAQLMDAAPVNALMAGDARNVMVVVDDAGFSDVPDGAMGYTAVTRHGAMRDTVIHIRQEFLVRAQGDSIARAGLDPSNFMPTARTSLAGKYVITHEWGHAHDMNDEATSAHQLRSVWDMDDGQGNAGGGLSSYGMSDPREAYAEAFTQHFLPPSTTSIASMMGSKRNVATEKYAEWNNWGTVAKGLAPKGTLTYPADMMTVVIYDTFKDAPIIKRDVPYGVHPTPVAKHGDPSRPNYASQHPNSRGGGFARNLTAIRSGRKVTVNPEDVEPMLELMSQGSDQPNLTLLSVKGMEGKTFDTENLGLDRSQMPQVPSQLKAKFIADMEAQGVGMKRSERNPIGLKPIQGEISGRSAGFIMQNEKKDRKVTDAARVLITRDGWILDGHHRWAGSVALELAGHGHSLPVLILDQDLGFAMDTVRKWGEANNVQSLDLGERNKKSDLSKTVVTFAAGVLKHGTPGERGYAQKHPTGGTQREGFRTATASDRERILRDHGYKVPEHWVDVLVPEGEDHLVVKGQDAKHEWHYVYNQEWKDQQASAKFQRTKELHKKMPQLDQALAKDVPKGSEDAMVVAIMRNTGCRVGQESAVQGRLVRDATYGASTLRAKHVKTTPTGSVILDFVGKDKVKQHYVIKDPVLTKAIEKQKKGKSGNDKMFPNSTDSTSVAYLRRVTGLPKVKNHDLRTHKANAVAIFLTKGKRRPATFKDYKKRRFAVGDAVAKQLGNTRAVSLSTYINPVVFEPWMRPEWIGKK